MNMKTRTLLTWLVVVVCVVAGFVLWNSAKNSASYSGFEAEETPAVPEQPAKASAPSAKTADAKRAEAAYTGTRILESGKYVTVVTLTSAGFSPQIVSINRGENIRFINKSGSAMRIASNEFQGVPILGSLNQSKSVGRDGVFELTLSEAGVWGYHNSNTALTGIVYVK